MSDILEVTDDTFDTVVLNSKLPVLVDFWAPWCAPCRDLSVNVEAIAKEYNDKIQVVKLNVDDNNVISARYSIRGIPTLLLFSKGDLLATKVGNISKSQLQVFIDSNV